MKKKDNGWHTHTITQNDLINPILQKDDKPMIHSIPMIEVSVAYLDELKRDIIELKENNKKLISIIEGLTTNPEKINNNILKTGNFKDEKDNFTI